MRPIGLANLRSSRANRWHTQFESKSETGRCVCVYLSAAGEHCYSLFPPRSHWILQFYAHFKCAPYHSPSLWHQAKHTHTHCKATALRERKKIAREGPKEKNQIGEACTYEMCGFGEMNGKILKLKDHLECVAQVFLTSFSFVQLNFEIAMACSTIGIEMVQRFYFFIIVVVVCVAVVFHFAIWELI